MVISRSIETWARSSNIQRARSFKEVGHIIVVWNLDSSNLSPRQPIFGACIRELGIKRSGSRVVGIERAVSLRLAFFDYRSSSEDTGIHARHIHKKRKRKRRGDNCRND